MHRQGEESIYYSRLEATREVIDMNADSQGRKLFLQFCSGPRDLPPLVFEEDVLQLSSLGKSFRRDSLYLIE